MAGQKTDKKISLKIRIAIPAIIFSISSFLFSCNTYKQIQYLQGDIDSTKYSKFNVPEQKVQKGDQISIAVFSDNAAASAMFNTGSIPSTSAGMSQASLPGSGVSSAGNVYEVDNEGMIFFPQIGKIYVEGQTKEGLTKLLNNELKDKFLTNPYYVIRFINLKITVFGDVNSPGVYPLTRANTNIFEALTLAGDMTFFGKRDNVLVIREQDGKRVFARIDVTKPDVFNSPYYYLQQNDIVFVDMRKGKVNSADQAWMRNVSFGLGLLSALTILVNLISR
jgi:polysaccharide export outer membrane protein